MKILFSKGWHSEKHILLNKATESVNILYKTSSGCIFKAYVTLPKLQNHKDFNQNPCYRLSVCGFSRKREIQALTKTCSRYWNASKRSSFCLPRKPLRYHCFHWFKSSITRKNQKFVNWDWNPPHYTTHFVIFSKSKKAFQPS